MAENKDQSSTQEHGDAEKEIVREIVRHEDVEIRQQEGPQIIQPDSQERDESSEVRDTHAPPTKPPGKGGA